MTLIEILVVIAIIALLAGGIAFGFNAVPRAKLRAGSLRLANTFRFAYIHALTTGRTTRVSFPLGTGQISVEDTEDVHTIERRDPNRPGTAEDVEAEARRDAQAMSDLRPCAPRAMFTALPPRTFRPLPREDVVITRLYSPHDPEPREQGTGHVYFFSGGLTERAVVHVRNTRGEIFSVALSPLTGRAEIFDRPVEPPNVVEREATDQDEVDERERAPLQESEQR
jgi:prepilin-type N-terminal cleavage/methylation domain-containing protein